MIQNDFQDECLLYYSDEDRCWIAHSLRSDQVGTGPDVVQALADLIKAIDQILALARREGDIEILREAPSEIKEKMKSANHLPNELYEIAHKIARGTWPEGFKVEAQPTETERYRTPIEEPVSA
jgi:hypothetical protein